MFDKYRRGRGGESALPCQTVKIPNPKLAGKYNSLVCLFSDYFIVLAFQIEVNSSIKHFIAQ